MGCIITPKAPKIITRVPSSVEIRLGLIQPRYNARYLTQQSATMLILREKFVPQQAKQINTRKIVNNRLKVCLSTTKGQGSRPKYKDGPKY